MRAPGGYQIGFDESRLPFIFMNSAETDRDIYTLLHESGHSFHQYALANQPILAYRDVPSEFAEVASIKEKSRFSPTFFISVPLLKFAFNLFMPLQGIVSEVYLHSVLLIIVT